MANARETHELRDGWLLAESRPGELAQTAGLEELSWEPASVPGTVAGAVRELNVDPDASDWWFRVAIDVEPCGADQQLVLCLDGIATVSDVFLNGTRILRSNSMFAVHEVDVSALVTGTDELVICCRALLPELEVQRRPRARWRTALVDGRLRFFRTMLLGRAPSFAPGPAVVGPWRPVRLERRTVLVVEATNLRGRVTGDGDGLLAVRVAMRTLGDTVAPDTLTVSVSGPTGPHEQRIAVTRIGQQLVASGEVQIPTVARWWPHTHGDPTLYDIRIRAADVELHHSRIGFRSLDWPADWEDAGLALCINGIAVFARGAVWTPLDMAAPDQPEAVVRAALEQVVSAGMNMVRIPGISCYESDVFYDLCDELGVLVWQDFMLANLDYPAGDHDWDKEFEAEVRHQLGRLAGRPSLAVLCGGSEVAQQVAMLGLDPELARGQLYVETLPRLIEAAGAAVPYVANSPWGGMLPFRPDRGVANYYGVGAYLRELSDPRLAEVKFAGECLAFSNVPDEAGLAEIEAPGGLVPHHPAWKAGVPRDAGAGWDFEDVRDFYLQMLYGEDPVQLRWTDPHRYLEVSRAVSGEVMAEVFGEWRRAASPCAGALVLWLRDLKPGAGWGVVDHTGRPKVAYHHLRRALAPVAVWITDEGLGGMTAHVANDRPERLAATLRVALYRDSEICVHQASVPVELEPNSTGTYDLETAIGRFVDVSLAYRFGRPNHDVVAASLEEVGPEPGLISNSFRFPAGRPFKQETALSLGLEASVVSLDSGVVALRMLSRRLVRGVRIQLPGRVPDDDAFTLEPGVERLVTVVPSQELCDEGAAAELTALNLLDRVRVARK